MFGGYNPYSGYGVDPNYYRALAEERSARDQYLAARRAQELARERAARARAARNTYASPYNSYLSDDYDDEVDDPWGAGYTYGQPSSFGLPPRQQRAMEEQRRRELLQLQREREMERLRLEEERRKLEEERRRHALLEEEQRRQREQFDPFSSFFGLRPSRGVDREMNGSSPQSRNAQRARTTPPVSRRAPPSPSPNQQTQPEPARASPKASPPPSPKPTPTPEEVAAAEKIQATFRAHAARKHAINAIDEVRAKFEKLRSEFNYPSGVDFVVNGETAHVPVPPRLSGPSSAIAHPDTDTDTDTDTESSPRLAYTAANRPLHAYEEELNRLLGALDAVESGGDAGVREHRKETVRMVEEEAEELERWRAGVWKAWEEQHAKEDGAPAAEIAAASAKKRRRHKHKKRHVPITSAESNMDSAYDAEAPREDGDHEDADADAEDEDGDDGEEPSPADAPPEPSAHTEGSQPEDIAYPSQTIAAEPSSLTESTTEHSEVPVPVVASAEAVVAPQEPQEMDIDADAEPSAVDDSTVPSEPANVSGSSSPDPDETVVEPMAIDEHDAPRPSTPPLTGGESDSEPEAGVRTPPHAEDAPPAVVHGTEVEPAVSGEREARKGTEAFVGAQWGDVDFDML